MGVVIVEDAERYGRKDAREVEEKCRREDFLRRLDARQAVLVIGGVVRQAAGEVLADALPEAAQLLRFLESIDTRATFTTVFPLAAALQAVEIQQNTRRAPRAPL